MNVLLKANHIYKTYQTKRSQRIVLKDINLEIKEGSIVSIIGESGGGKTTLCKIIAGIEKPDAGMIFLKDNPLGTFKKRSFEDCTSIQYIFQDPYSALEEEERICDTLQEPLLFCKRWKRQFLEPEKALSLVGLDGENFMNKKVRTLSGGQRQRVCIARALITCPKLILADESTAMLDEGSSNEICRIFKKLKDNYKISFLIVTHHRKILQDISDEIYVLHEGKIVEQGKTKKLIYSPSMDYTREYMESMMRIEGGFVFEQNYSCESNRWKNKRASV